LAQQTAGFSANSLIGCAPFTLEVTENANTGSTYTIYEYGDNTPITPQTTHTYRNSGTYTVIQRINNDNAVNKEASLVITVLPAEIPEFSYNLCKNREVFVTVDDAQYPAYKLNFGDGNIQIVLPGETISHTYASTNNFNISLQGLVNENNSPGSAANVSCGTKVRSITPRDILPAPLLSRIREVNENSTNLEFTLQRGIQYQIEYSVNGTANFTPLGVPDSQSFYLATGLDNANNYYCFRIAATDPCDGEIIYSNVVCSQLDEVLAENNENLITWETASENISSYQIFRDNMLIETINNPGARAYSDQDVLCNEEYCYRIVANFIQGESQNLASCAVAQSDDTPPTIEDATASVEVQGINISWPEPLIQAKEYYIERSSDRGDYERITVTDTNSFLEEGINIENNFSCYKISYLDECGNLSEISGDICPILLTVSQNERNFNELVWTDYQGWSSGVDNYFIEKYDDEGNLFETVPIQAGLFYYLDDQENDNRQIITYKIRAVSLGTENWTVFSNPIYTEQPVRVFFPSAFTPNGDGLNDEFIAKGKFIRDLNMKIFNRWGELIFYSDNISEGWHGDYLGNPAPEGSYVYRVEVTDYNNKTISLSGSFMLLRPR
jgi:gliding motility-associated-like protein